MESVGRHWVHSLQCPQTLHWEIPDVAMEVSFARLGFYPRKNGSIFQAWPSLPEDISHEVPEDVSEKKKIYTEFSHHEANLLDEVSLELYHLSPNEAVNQDRYWKTNGFLLQMVGFPYCHVSLLEGKLSNS